MLDLITDRTQADCTYAAAHPDSLEPLKGAYNAADFNRVGEALNYLSALLLSLGYGTGPTLRTDWSSSDNISYVDGTAYLNTIRQVHDSIMSTAADALPNDIQDIFAARGHEKANAIEQILLDVEAVISIMFTTFVPCGDAVCGGDYL